PYLPPEAQPLVHERIAEAIRFSVLDISTEGNWPIGTGSHHRESSHWHTAACLDHLLTLYEYLRDDELLPVIKLVYTYYLSNFFTEEGLPSNPGSSSHLISIAAVAQGVALMPRLRQ